jgi:hypothetical protein
MQQHCRARTYDYNALVLREAVHARQQLVQRLSVGVGSHGDAASLAAHRVDLVDEDDRGGLPRATTARRDDTP